VPARRPSPALLLATFVLACGTPLAVAAATGLTADHRGGDSVETADGGPRELASASGPTVTGPDGLPITTGIIGDPSSSGDGDGSGAGRRSGPPATGTADIPPTTTSTTTTPAPSVPTTPTAPLGTPAPPPPASTTPTTAPAPSAVTPLDRVAYLVNTARAQAGCPALVVEPHLNAAAQGHSDDMAARNYFSHDTPEGKDFATRILEAGYPGNPGGENIAKGQRTAQQVMTDWMNSSGHRANILNCRFTAIGLGLNTSAWTWTQDFGY
jgi:uncharacterized protein YkwD